MKPKPLNTFETVDNTEDGNNKSNNSAKFVLEHLCLAGLAYYQFIYKPKKEIQIAKMKEEK